MVGDSLEIYYDDDQAGDLAVLLCRDKGNKQVTLSLPWLTEDFSGRHPCVVLSVEEATKIRDFLNIFIDEESTRH